MVSHSRFGFNEREKTALLHQTRIQIKSILLFVACVGSSIPSSYPSARRYFTWWFYFSILVLLIGKKVIIIMPFISVTLYDVNNNKHDDDDDDQLTPLLLLSSEESSNDNTNHQDQVKQPSCHYHYDRIFKLASMMASLILGFGAQWISTFAGLAFVKRYVGSVLYHVDEDQRRIITAFSHTNVRLLIHSIAPRKRHGFYNDATALQIIRLVMIISLFY